MSKSQERPSKWWWSDNKWLSDVEKSKQAAINAVHDALCGCKTVWRPYDGIGSSKMYFDHIDWYYGTKLDHIIEALPTMWQITLGTVTTRLAAEIAKKKLDWQKKIAKDHEYTPKGVS
jgi:hypothetical protein